MPKSPEGGRPPEQEVEGMSEKKRQVQRIIEEIVGPVKHKWKYIKFECDAAVTECHFEYSNGDSNETQRAARVEEREFWQSTFNELTARLDSIKVGLHPGYSSFDEDGGGNTFEIYERTPLK